MCRAFELVTGNEHIHFTKKGVERLNDLIEDKERIG
jgi:hypothetical protein